MTSAETTAVEESREEQKQQHQQIDTGSIKAKLLNTFGWFSTTVGAITLFSSLVGLIELAPSAKWLVDHWNNIIHFVWKNVLFFLPHISELDASVLTIFFAFISVILWASVGKRDKKHRNTLGLFIILSSVFFLLYSNNIESNVLGESWAKANQYLIDKQGKIRAKIKKTMAEADETLKKLDKLPKPSENEVRLKHSLEQSLVKLSELEKKTERHYNILSLQSKNGYVFSYYMILYEYVSYSLNRRLASIPVDPLIVMYVNIILGVIVISGSIFLSYILLKLLVTSRLNFHQASKRLFTVLSFALCIVALNYVAIGVEYAKGQIEGEASGRTAEAC